MAQSTNPNVYSFPPVAQTKLRTKSRPAFYTASSVHEVNYMYDPQSSKLHVKYYLSDEDRRKVIKETGEAGCLLLDYYLRLAGREHCEITDKVTAFHFGWTEQKAKRYRRNLTQHGWFRQVKFNSANGRKPVSYYVGKDSVMDSYII